MIYAIGDIHGEVEALNRLLSQIEGDAHQRGIDRPRLVLLGDYGDRGPNSRAVYDLLASPNFGGRFNPVLIRGNHEMMLLDSEHDFGRTPHWLANGGLALLESYGCDLAELSVALLAKFFADFPLPHRMVLARTKLWHEEAGYLFVHAGIDPDDPLGRDPQILTWTREPFLSRDLPPSPTVVHGHTPSFSVEVRTGRIGLDTGSGYGPGFTLSSAILEPFGGLAGILEEGI